MPWKPVPLSIFQHVSVLLFIGKARFLVRTLLLRYFTFPEFIVYETWTETLVPILRTIYGLCKMTQFHVFVWTLTVWTLVTTANLYCACCQIGCQEGSNNDRWKQRIQWIGPLIEGFNILQKKYTSHIKLEKLWTLRTFQLGKTKIGPSCHLRRKILTRKAINNKKWDI